MSRLRGTPLLVCDCGKPNGTPLVIGTNAPLNSHAGLDARCLLKKLQVSEDVTRFTGNCPRCNRFVDVRLKERIGPLLHGISSPLPVEYEPIEELLYVLNVHFNPEKDMAYLSSGIRIIPLTARRFHGKVTIYEVPSPSGPKSLRVDSETKRFFVHRLQTDGKYSSFVPNELLPDWYPGGTDDDFEEWLGDLDYGEIFFHHYQELNAGQANIDFASLLDVARSPEYGRWLQTNYDRLLDWLKSQCAERESSEE